MRLTYAQVDAAANQAANFLVSAGLRPGEAVALSCPNRAEFPVLYYGILKAGGVVVPLSVLLNVRELAYHLRDSGARFFFCWAGDDELRLAEHGRAAFGRVDGCEQFVPFDGAANTLTDTFAGQPTTFSTVASSPEDTAAILYPSRVPGDPKGVELTHGNLLDNASRIAELSGCAPQTHLVVLPLFHAVAQTTQMNAGFATGGTIVLLPRFDPARALTVMANEQVTAVVAVPTMYWALIGTAASHPAEISAAAEHLRLAYSELAPLPDDVRSQFLRLFGVEILEGYGLSETSAIALHARATDGQPGSVGKPLDGVQVRLVDAEFRDVPENEAGQIVVRGPNIMKGYHKRPDETARALKDGWFQTGDVAHRNASGLYFMDDRPKRMVLRGGLAVYPRAVEEALLTHPAVSTAEVVGIPHPHHGEELRTVIVRKPGAVISEAELVAWCRQQLPDFVGDLEVRDDTTAAAPRRRLGVFLPGVALVIGAVTVAFLVNRVLPVVSALTVGVLLGALITNTAGIAATLRPGLHLATRRLLRAGVVLLGLQLSIPDLLHLGVPLLLAVLVTVAVGFLGTRWLGARLGLSRNLSLLTATGFSICGASAIAAMESATDSDEDEVATAVALVTIFGTLALLVWPALQGPLGLSGPAFGAWAGASVHEVAQVVAAASPAGDVALATAVIVKLSRVVLLAPLVAAVTIAARRRSGGTGAAKIRKTAVVPAFVLGFLGMIAVRSTGILPSGVLALAKVATTALLAAALFGLGTGVRLHVLIRTGPRAIALGAASTLLLAATAYAGVRLATIG